MVFEISDLKLEFIEALYIDQKDVNLFNVGRPFDALSLRLSTDAVLTYADKTYTAHDYDVCFVPSYTDYTRIADTDRMIVIHFRAVGYTEKNICSFHPKDPIHFEALFRKIWDTWKKKATGYRYLCTSLLYEIFAECHQAHRTEAAAVPSVIADAVAYLHAHFRDPFLTVGACAKASFISEVYFRKCFRAQFGISPQAYIIRLRIKYALELMGSGYYTLKEVASLSGYRDYKYFSVECKRATGKTPSEHLGKHE